jgi:hypothetical protein
MPAFHRLLFNCSPDTLIAIAIPTLCTVVLAEAYFRTSLSDADSSTTCRYQPTLSAVSLEHVRELERSGYVVIRNAITPHVLTRARKDVSTIMLERHDELAGGEVGSDDYREAASSAGQKLSSKASFFVKADSGDDDDSENDSKKVRGDSVCWLRKSDGCGEKTSLLARATVSFRSDENNNKAPLGDGILHCIKLLRGVPHALEAYHYATSRSHSHRIPQQCQLARYPAQSGYPRHLDQCDSNLAELGLLEYWRLSDYRGRSITSILYLNDDEWEGDLDGGQIRCYHRTGDTNRDGHKGGGTRGTTDETFEDIIPLGGTLLIFDSRRIEHEVLPARRERLALTSWANRTLKDS